MFYEPCAEQSNRIAKESHLDCHDEYQPSECLQHSCKPQNVIPATSKQHRGSLEDPNKLSETENCKDSWKHSDAQSRIHPGKQMDSENLVETENASYPEVKTYSEDDAGNLMDTADQIGTEQKDSCGLEIQINTANQTGAEQINTCSQVQTDTGPTEKPLDGSVSAAAYHPLFPGAVPEQIGVIAGSVWQPVVCPVYRFSINCSPVWGHCQPSVPQPMYCPQQYLQLPIPASAGFSGPGFHSVCQPVPPEVHGDEATTAVSEKPDDIAAYPEYLSPPATWMGNQASPFVPLFVPQFLSVMGNGNPVPLLNKHGTDCFSSQQCYDQNRVPLFQGHFVHVPSPNPPTPQSFNESADSQHAFHQYSFAQGQQPFCYYPSLQFVGQLQSHQEEHDAYPQVPKEELRDSFVEELPEQPQQSAEQQNHFLSAVTHHETFKDQFQMSSHVDTEQQTRQGIDGEIEHEQHHLQFCEQPEKSQPHSETEGEVAIQCNKNQSDHSGNQSQRCRSDSGKYHQTTKVDQLPEHFLEFPSKQNEQSSKECQDPDQNIGLLPQPVRKKLLQLGSCPQNLLEQPQQSHDQGEQPQQSISKAEQSLNISLQNSPKESHLRYPESCHGVQNKSYNLSQESQRPLNWSCDHMSQNSVPSQQSPWQNSLPSQTSKRKQRMATLPPKKTFEDRDKVTEHRKTPSLRRTQNNKATSRDTKSHKNSDKGKMKITSSSPAIFSKADFPELSHSNQKTQLYEHIFKRYEEKHRFRTYKEMVEQKINLINKWLEGVNNFYPHPMGDFCHEQKQAEAIEASGSTQLPEETKVVSTGGNLTEGSDRVDDQTVKEVPATSASATSSTSSISTSWTLTSQVMDSSAARQAILGVEAGAEEGASTANPSPTKSKKKKKRPKSAQASSSSESTPSAQATSQEGDGANVKLTDSLSAMSLSGAEASPAQESTEAPAVDGSAEVQKDKKKRKKKKKKDKAEASEEGAVQDVEMAGSAPVEAQAGEVKGPGDMTNQQAATPLPPNIVRLQQILLQRQNTASQQKQLHQQQHQQQQWQQQKQQQQPRQHHQQQQQGQRGQNTPQSSNKKQQHKKNIFEPYWPMERVSEGLKRGTLIEGKIRINPKNYEDAYVPLPDGTADVYIAGMPDRNRALNGDTVAVLFQDRDNWRVFTDEVNNYEKSNTPPAPQKPVEENKADETKDDKNDEEDGPDVVVEEEEEMELDEAGKPITSTRTIRPASSVSAPSPQATPTTQVGNTSSSQATPSGQKGQSPNKGSRQNDNKGSKGGGTPGSSCKQKRYMSVKEAMDQGSSVVKRLFVSEGPGGAEGGGEKETSGGAVNIDRFMQRTGKVVAITEKKHSRAASGNLRPMQDCNHNFATFAPSDSRIPRIMIPATVLPPGFKERPEDFTSVLFIARITEWNETSKMPKGTLARSLGEAGQVEPETEALLIENDVDSTDFSDEVLACLPQESPWTIPAEELKWRRDLRKECVFTIDPSTARDLDDALHCKDLGDGVYEVGVHIADVSYFVKENTKLDEVACSRATSVYLVQKVIPMLPRLLCEQLCSLNPDEDRLSFSVVWKITEDGEILEEWFGRTVIRSCVKLSYDHAQGFIEDPNRDWTTDELPPISEGFTVEDIKSRVLKMNKMAKAMRKARFDSGALRLDQVKIQYTLNKETGLPDGYFVYQQRDSNKLVEEFMLLANMAVAHKIRSAHKDKALLRRHPPPQSRMIEDLKVLCTSLGFPIEVSSAREIQLSLARYTGQDDMSRARLQVLVVLCSKPMQNAKYFCCGVLADEQLYRHYALNVPLYTHFTSPIRRYPDILVHRTLAAALGYCDVTERSSAEVHKIAGHCNDKKTNAKLCSERSNDLYFSIFVKEAGPLEEKGMVMAVLDKSFDVYVLKLGVVKRVYCEKLPLESYSFHKEVKRPELTMVWKPDDGCPRKVTQKISIFSSVNCVLQPEKELLRWSAIIRRPLDGDPSIVE